MMETVKGPRLYLRKLELSDLDRTWEWLHRKDVYSKIGVQVPFSKEQQLTWFARLQNDAIKIVFAVCRIEGGIHIGNVSLDMIDRRHQNARLSIFIADKNARGKGFGSEALALLEKYAFSELNLHKIWCKTDADDPRTIHFYERLGFKLEGLLIEHEIKEGRFVNKALLAKINSERA